MLTACSAPGNRYAWSGVVSFTSKPTLCFSRHQPEIPVNFDLSCWVRTDPSGDIQVPQVFSLPQTTSESGLSACPPNLQISHSMCPSSRVAIWQTVWQKKKLRHLCPGHSLETGMFRRCGKDYEAPSPSWGTLLSQHTFPCSPPCRISNCLYDGAFMKLLLWGIIDGVTGHWWSGEPLPLQVLEGGQLSKLVRSF